MKGKKLQKSLQDKAFPRLFNMGRRYFNAEVKFSVPHFSGV